MPAFPSLPTNIELPPENLASSEVDRQVLWGGRPKITPGAKYLRTLDAGTLKSDYNCKHMLFASLYTSKKGPTNSFGLDDIYMGTESTSTET